MPVTLMKYIDEYIGRILVLIISGFKNLFGKKKIHKTGKSNNILFIKFWGIGSIILTSPAVRKVRTANPDSKIYYLTLKGNYDICRELKSADEIITVDISNPAAFIYDFINKTKLLRKIDFDAVYDFEFYTYFSALVISLLKCRRSFGFDNLKNKRKILFTDTILFDDHIHTKDNFLHLVNADESVSSVNSAPPAFPDLKTISNNSNGIMKIVVNVNASKLAYERRLPEKNYVEIINHVTERFKCKVILTGSTSEMEYVRGINNNIINKDLVTDLSGKTSVSELITLISSSYCLITNDSGPLHIASASNIPVIAFFGPETPVRYGPLSNKSLVFYNALECSPCMSISNSKTVNCIYDSPKCMEQFDMKEVIRKIDLFISELNVMHDHIISE
ncbi:MAG TPA: glycosyltransferase family 9 protein [Ignavibacteria bacterium]|nr:glycosyltransferase family 9 protein [Ignavibacteria bacterium]